MFCGSDQGLSPTYAEEAGRLASALAAAKIGLVYGGGATGLMGIVARTLKNYGGYVTGIIPQELLSTEQLFSDLDVRHVVNSYHERKMLMYHLSDGFIVLPGGPGTLEELMEHLTWMHRGRSYKPVYIINQSGYWNPLFQMFRSMQETGFISHDFDCRYSICESASDAICDFLRRPVSPASPQYRRSNEKSSADVARLERTQDHPPRPPDVERK